MRRVPRRFWITWGLRLVLGVALGWGVRVVYERRPLVRFATGLAVRTVSQSGVGAVPRGAHVRDGQPLFFSLDQIMAADDPAAALQAWREAFERAPEPIRRHVLQTRAEVSIGALRQLLMHLPRQAALRDEMNALLTLAREVGTDVYDEDTTLRSLMELARLDAGLALDGAHAIEHDRAIQMIWAIIAEDHPEHVIQLAQRGQAPEDALRAAIAALAATDLAKADALISSFPEDQIDGAVRVLADVLARTQPLDAVLQAGPDGRPDPNWADMVIENVPGPMVVDFLLGLELQNPDLLAACNQSVVQLLRKQAAHNPEFVLAWMERQPPGAHHAFSIPGGPLTLAAAHDPARAATLLQTWPSDRWTGQTRDHLAREWMSRDPVAALDWMRSQTNADDWLGRAAEGARRVRPEDAPAVARWFSENPSAVAAGLPDGLPSLVRPWVEHDAAGAVAWATQLPDGPLRIQGVGSAAVALAQSGHPQASTWIESLVDASPESLPQIVLEVPIGATRLGPLIVDALPELVSSAPEDTHLHRSIADHLTQMVRDSDTRAATMDAIARLPDPTHQQQLLSRLAESTNATNPHTSRLAFALADAMPDPIAARKLAETAVMRRFR